MKRPTRFGRYQIKEVIGRGGMGIVYLGEDPVIGRSVAVKAILATEEADDPESEDLLARFEREFRVAGTLSHPNIVTIFDVGQEEHSSFIAMEYIEGDSLSDRLESGDSHTFRQISELARQLCGALDYAHAEGVVHRDVKPANILFTGTGVAKITDFGIAKLASSDMTRTGTLLGTPWYMSPEQIAGGDITGASDQFSVGVILYQMLTGESPFKGDTPTTVLYKIVHEAPVAPQRLNTRLPEPVGGVLLRALEKAPEDRYPDCSSLASELHRALEELAGSESILDLPVGEQGEPTLVLGQGRESAPRSGGEAGGAPASASGETRARESTTYSALQGKSHWRPILAALGVAVLVAVGALLWTRGSEMSFIPVAPTAMPSSAAGEIYHTLSVRPGVEGAAIWVDGEDSGLETPAEVELAGEPGGTVHLALRVDGAPVAETELLLGDEMPEAWNPEIEPDDDVAAAATPAERRGPSPEPAAAPGGNTFQIITQPAGAEILVDGEPAGLETPAELELLPGALLRLELDGYVSAERLFDADGLTDDERDGSTLTFDLPPIPPPGLLDPEARTVVAGKQVDTPQILHRVEPVYPEAARAAGLSGLVILELTLDPRGQVAECSVLRSLDPALDSAAVQAVLARRYEPATYRKKPVNVRMTVTVVFPPSPAGE